MISCFFTLQSAQINRVALLEGPSAARQAPSNYLNMLSKCPDFFEWIWSCCQSELLSKATDKIQDCFLRISLPLERQLVIHWACCMSAVNFLSGSEHDTSLVCPPKRSKKSGSLPWGSQYHQTSTQQLFKHVEWVSWCSGVDLIRLSDWTALQSCQ